MLNVYIRCVPAVFLRGGDDVQRKRSLTGGLRPVYLDDTAARNAADAEGKVKGQRAGGERFDVDRDIVSKAHDGALAVVLFYLRNGCFERFFLIAACGRGHCNCFFLLGHLFSLSYDQNDFIYLIYIFPMTTRSIIWVSFLVCAEAKPAAMSISHTALA